jgi:hypothetical protein
MDVVIGDRTYKAQDSAGSLAIVKGKNGKFSVVDVHTGKLLSKKDTLGDARTEMHKHAPRHQSHVQKSLDSNGRAFETIRPPKGIKAGSTKNSLDDIMNMSESIVEASKHVYKNGQTVFNPKTRRGNGEVAIQRGGARGDIFMSAIQQAYGADALPQKVSKKELDRMLHAGEVSTTMVRGSGSKYKEFNDGPGFSSGETVRLHGAGAYTASQGGPNKRTDQYARIYTNGYKAGPNTLNVMGLRAGAKTVDTQTIGTQMMSWKRRELGKLSPSDPNWSQKRDFIEALTSDKGYFATAMGYDAITAKYGGFDGIIVLNRSALVVQDTFE